MVSSLRQDELAWMAYSSGSIAVVKVSSVGMSESEGITCLVFTPVVVH